MEGVACATALQAQHSSGSDAHRRPHPGLYRPNNTRTVVRNTLYKHQHPVHIHFRTHEPAPCCDSHQLPGRTVRCGKQQGPRVGALHCVYAPCVACTPLLHAVPGAFISSSGPALD